MFACSGPNPNPPPRLSPDQVYRKTDTDDGDRGLENATDEEDEIVEDEDESLLSSSSSAAAAAAVPRAPVGTGKVDSIDTR